ncbi:YoaK family protein [Sphingomonas adhaesiva]|uniref:YoaK family protein n=1 Tax=Sphingomonas adhaesiva TaxID=28212 RepID=UPI002FFC495B
MIRYRPRSWLFAACLSLLAGYIDAIGFLRLGGLFVSFMSGNSTRLAVALAVDRPLAVLAGALIAAFVAGVILGTCIGHAAGRHRAPAVLLTVALLLVLAMLADGVGAGRVVMAVALACAMGAENAVFERDGEVSIGVTYMTGTLVKLGQRIAAALRGGARLGWLPYLLLWSGLVTGAVAGATAFRQMGAAAIGVAAAGAVVLAIVTALAGGVDSYTSPPPGD